MIFSVCFPVQTWCENGDDDDDDDDVEQIQERICQLGRPQ